RPLAQSRSCSIASADVIETGTTLRAATASDTSSSADSRQQLLISAPVKPSPAGRAPDPTRRPSSRSGVRARPVPARLLRVHTSPGIAVAWYRCDTVPDRVLRRWQLAAEAGGGVGMLFRPLSATRQRSWSDLRLTVTPIVHSSRFSRTVRVEVVYCRG